MFKFEFKFKFKFKIFILTFLPSPIEGDVFSFDDDLVKIIQISIIVKVQDIYVSS